MTLNAVDVSNIRASDRIPETPLAALPFASTEKMSSLVPVGNKRSPRCGGA
jgi:hypothetical protein